MVVQDSLSVVLAVQNAQQELVENVTKLLDILPDLTHRFEILILDNGSADQTSEVAYELAREYPQIRVAALAEPQSRTAVVEAALARTSGDVLFLQEQDTPINSNEFQKLWAIRSDNELLNPLMDRLGKKSQSPKKPAAWGFQLQTRQPNGSRGGLQMICRETAPARQELRMRTQPKVARRDSAQTLERRSHELTPVATKPFRSGT